MYLNVENITAYPYAKALRVDNTFYIPIAPPGKLKKFFAENRVEVLNQQAIRKHLPWLKELGTNEKRFVYLLNFRMLVIESSHHIELAHYAGYCSVLAYQIRTICNVSKHLDLIRESARNNRPFASVLAEIKQLEHKDDILLTQLIGFRVFNIVNGSLISSIISSIISDIKFTKGWNTACCTMRSHKEPAPVATCSCGFYSVKPNAEGYKIIDNYLYGGHNMIGAIVEMRGKVAIHKAGYRAAQIKIIRLVSFKHSVTSEVLEDLAYYYQVPVILTSQETYQKDISHYLTQESYV